MYSQLLTAAWDEFADDPEYDGATSGELLARLLDLRAAVHPGSDGEQGGDGLGPKGLDTMANELTYDLTLLRLASAVGIPAEPRRFTDPRSERRRLEGELSTSGVNLGELGGRARAESDGS